MSDELTKVDLERLEVWGRIQALTEERNRIDRDLAVVREHWLQLLKNHCLHCGHVWKPKSVRRAVCCPECKSPRWDKPQLWRKHKKLEPKVEQMPADEEAQEYWKRRGLTPPPPLPEIVFEQEQSKEGDSVAPTGDERSLESESEVTGEHGAAEETSAVVVEQEP